MSKSECEKIKREKQDRGVSNSNPFEGEIRCSSVFLNLLKITVTLFTNFSEFNYCSTEILLMHKNEGRFIVDE